MKNYVLNLKQPIVTIPKWKHAFFEDRNHSLCVTRDTCHVKKIPKETVAFAFPEHIRNDTIVGEVVQSRCNLLFAKNVCFGDIFCQKCRKKVYRLKTMGLVSKSFPSPCIPALGTSPYTEDAAVYTDKSSFKCQVNDESAWTPHTNLSISTNITLHVFLLKKLRGPALFVTKSRGAGTTEIAYQNSKYLEHLI